MTKQDGDVHKSKDYPSDKDFYKGWIIDIISDEDDRDILRAIYLFMIRIVKR